MKFYEATYDWMPPARSVRHASRKPSAIYPHPVGLDIWYGGNPDSLRENGRPRRRACPLGKTQG